MTNADKIRNMTDEELADFLASRLDKCYRCHNDEGILCEENPMCAGTMSWVTKEVGIE